MTRCTRGCRLSTVCPGCALYTGGATINIQCVRHRPRSARQARRLTCGTLKLPGRTRRTRHSGGRAVLTCRTRGARPGPRVRRRPTIGQLSLRARRALGARHHRRRAVLPRLTDSACGRALNAKRICHSPSHTCCAWCCRRCTVLTSHTCRAAHTSHITQHVRHRPRSAHQACVLPSTVLILPCFAYLTRSGERIYEVPWRTRQAGCTRVEARPACRTVRLSSAVL